MRSHELIYGLRAKIEGGFAGVRAEIQATREASEERNRGIHKRMDRFEDHTRSEFREIRSKMERSKAPTSGLTYGSLLSALITHWDKVLAILLMAASAFGILSPDKAKSILGLTK